MTAKEYNFGFIINKGIIKIPYFQRNYIWNENHWQKLWTDLIDSFEQRYIHFFGSIILKGMESGSCLLIDGQQRTTTFSLLLRAIGEELNLLDKYNNLQYCLFAQDENFNRIPKIQHSRLDKEIFQKIILGEKFEENNSMIHKCYGFFSKKVSEYKSEKGVSRLRLFLDKILNDKLFVIVEVEKDEDEQRIFDSINTSGQPLANFDIVKNELFSHFDNQKEAEKIYDEYWVPIFEDNEEIRIFWDDEILTGREKRYRKDIFLHNFAIIEGIYDPSNVTLSKMNEVYKKHIKEQDANTIIKFIKKFTEYANVFKELPFFNQDEEYEYTDTMKRFLHITHVLQLSTFIPIALFLELVRKQKDLSEKDYKNSLILLEKYVILRSILKLDTSGYNKTVYTIVRELSGSSDVYKKLEEIINNYKADTDRFPQKEEIRGQLFENFDTNLAKLLLFWIELYNRYSHKDFSDSKINLKYSFQLEHIMPKAWDKYWVLPNINKTYETIVKECETKTNKTKNEIVSSDIVDYLNESYGESQKIIDFCNLRDEKIYEFGNFTLLTGKLNNSLKNYEWKRKRDGDGKKNGIKYYSSLFLNKKLCEHEQWTEDKITERTKKLKEIIQKIWG